MPRVSAIHWVLPIVATAAGVAGIVAAWVAVGSRTVTTVPSPAVDVALMLHLTHAPPGRARSVLATLATLVAVALAQWLLAATRMGALVGIEPLASAARLGPALGWQVVQLGLDRVDWVLLLSSLPLAAILVEPDRPVVA